MYFDANVEAILKNHPWQEAMATKLRETEAVTDAELYETSDGNYTLLYKNVYLHDPQGPIQEAKKAIEKLVTLRPDKVQIIVGLGLGYVLQELFEASHGKIVVYEPDVPFLRFVLENVGLSEYLGHERVTLATNIEELEIAVKRQMIGDFEVDAVGIRSSSILYTEEVKVMSEKMQEWYKINRMDRVTVGRYHVPWVQEMLRNFPSFASMRNTSELHEKYHGKPALVISSGPSLDKAMESVKELADKMVLVSVGGALRALHKAEVAPDFALFYDVLGMKEQFNNLPQEYLDKIIFVLCPFSQHECFKAPVRAHMLFHSNNIHPIVHWIEEVMDEKHGRLGGGATVSVVGFQLAAAMKCDPIVLVGQDLAFTNNQVYAGGVMMKTDGKGNLTLEGNENLYAEAAPMSEVKGQNGEMLPTLTTYALFLKAFEEMAEWMKKQEDPTKLYNASIGGAAIEGYEVKPLDQFVGLFEAWKKPFAVEGDLSLDPETVAARRAKMEAGLTKLKTGVQKALSISKRMQRTLPDVNPRQLNKGGNQDKIVKGMRDLNKQYNDVLAAHPVVEFLLTTETCNYKQQFMHKLESEEAFNVWFKAMEQLLESTVKTLGEDILPILEATEKELHAARETAPLSVAS